MLPSNKFRGTAATEGTESKVWTANRVHRLSVLESLPWGQVADAPSGGHRPTRSGF